MKAIKRYFKGAVRPSLRLLLLGVVFASVPLLGHSQDRLRVNVGYHSVMITKPGIRGGAEYTLKEQTKPSFLDRYLSLGAMKSARWVVAPQVGMYWDPQSFTAIHGALEAGRVVQAPGGALRQWRLGPGFHYAILPEVYEVTGGVVEPLGLGGRGFFSVSGIYGFGFKVRDALLWANLHAQVLMPYNYTILPVAGIELVYQFTPKLR